MKSLYPRYCNLKGDRKITVELADGAICASVYSRLHKTSKKN